MKNIKKLELFTLSFLANKYILKVNDRNTRKRCEICSNLVRYLKLKPFANENITPNFYGLGSVSLEN